MIMRKSNITLKSNIYPIVKKLINKDIQFLRHVEGRAALKIVNMESDYRYGRDFTVEQNNDWNDETNCSGFDTGDHPWGHIMKNGQLQRTCRCLNLSCQSFKVCRPDFNEEELKYLIVNINEQIIQGDNANIHQINLPDPKFYNGRISDKHENMEEIEDRGTIHKDLEEDTDNQIFIDGISSIWSKINDTEEKKGQINDKKMKPSHKEDGKDNIETEDNVRKAKIDKKALNIVDQKYVIGAAENAKLIVNAGPGTGKTYTLIERLKYLTDKCGLVPAQEMLVLCFSKAAIAEIRKRIEQEIKSGEANDDLRFLDIRTFDSFATFLITQLDEEADLSFKSYEERIKMATDMIEANTEVFGDLKHFIVDEIQDLVGERAKLVQSILKASPSGFTLLGDSCQSIYDYQIEENEINIDSVKFYKWLEDYFGDQIERVEFEGNHRQTSKLHNMGSNIRKSILSNEEADEKIEKIAETLRKIHSIGKCSELTPEKINDSTSTCFLCRNNGEVLKLSQQLRNQGVSNAIQKPATSKLIKPWLGMVLGEYAKDTIDYFEFRELLNHYYSEAEVEDVKKKWNTLENLDREARSRLTIKNILDNIYMERSISNDLFISDKSNIVVSTIHRAKGREYDKVVLLEDSFERLLNKSNESNRDEETKIFYVAITRPKTEINVTKFNRKAYLKPVIGGEKRWIETGKNPYKKFKYISGFEVGVEKDINNISFIDLGIFKNEKAVLDNQDYIRTQVSRGDEVVLRRVDFSDRLQDSLYYIYHNDRILGSMSKNFTWGLVNALKQVNGSKYIKKLPLEIQKSYVDEIITCISKDMDTEVLSIYKKTHIWNGISLVGFGRLIWNESDL